MSINKVIISGKLTRDPELRANTSGKPILGFGVAVNDRIKNQQTGEWEDRPNFIDCVVFGARAEALAKILTKGMKVAVEGKLRWSQWEKDGQKRSKVEVIAEEVELMSQRSQEQAPPVQPYGYTPGQQQQPYAQQGYPQVTYSDTPVF